MRFQLLILAVAACGGGGSNQPATSTSTSTPTTTTATTADAQIARGGELYGANCASCHGDGGQGSDKAPLVVGAGRLPRSPRDGAKRDVEFVTAADVFAWVGANMPPTAPGSLPTDDYLAILAFDLSANGVALTEPLTVEQLAEITINP